MPHDDGFPPATPLPWSIQGRRLCVTALRQFCQLATAAGPRPRAVTLPSFTRTPPVSRAGARPGRARGSDCDPAPVKRVLGVVVPRRGRVPGGHERVDQGLVLGVELLSDCREVVGP